MNFFFYIIIIFFMPRLKFLSFYTVLIKLGRYVPRQRRQKLVRSKTHANLTASAQIVQVIKWTQESGYRSHGELTNLIN